MKLYFPIIREVIHQNENILYLLSYLRQHSDVPFTSHIINPRNFHTIENSPDNYILFSSTSIKPLIKLDQLIKTLRKMFGTIKCKIILGGAVFYVLNKEDIFKHYPEVTHICVGKGEEVLKAILSQNLAPGIHRAEDFAKVQPYTLSPEFAVKDVVLLTFRDSRCSWNKCLFCHHKTRCVYPNKNAQQVATDIMYYIDRFGYRLFYFYDNHMDPDLLAEMLEILFEKGYAQHKPCFYVFGIRVDSNMERLKNILGKWPKSTIDGVAWGIEFYDQEILDRYKKGTTLAQIDSALQFFPQFGTSNDVYLLFGLPTVEKKHIASQDAFIKASYPVIRQYMTSYFLLNNALKIKEHEDEFKIKENGFCYSIQDFFDYANDTEPILTEFIDFCSWDEDLKKYATRDETFKKYIPLMQKYSKIGTSPSLAFISPQTRQILRRVRPDLFF